MDHKLEVVDPKENDNFVIQYGDTWFLDLLDNMQGNVNCPIDFQVFLSDVIFWTNGWILTAMGQSMPGQT